MEGKSRRAMGWKFRQARLGSQPNLAIQYGGHSPTDFLDEATTREIIKQIRELDADDITSFLQVIPPLGQLIKSIPQSLQLIEAIYMKCAQSDATSEFPSKALHCEELFRRLVWWIAFSEQSPTSGAEIPHHLSEGISPCVVTLLGLIGRECPWLVVEAVGFRAQLTVSLEALGCHGLVNCSSGLIRLGDAVHLETGRHLDKVKCALHASKDLKTGKDESAKESAAPCKASHQRQMNLRLSDIFERLKQNEAIEALLDDVLTSHHLSSLLRIVRKRISSDKMLINIFNAFNKSAPEEFSFQDVDPVVARLIVNFKNAYDKILAIVPSEENDSGCGNDSSSSDPEIGRESNSSSCAPTTDSSPTSLLTAQSDSSGSGDQQRLLRFRTQKALEHHRSVGELRDERSRLARSRSSKNLQPAKSFANLRSLALVGAPQDAEAMRRVDVANILGARYEHDDTLKLRLHINHLKSELKNAKRRIEELTHGPQALITQRLWPEPDYPEATSYYNCSTQEDVETLISRFADLYYRDRDEIMATLDGLSEFRGSEDLQLKVILSVIVLTYRSVVESVSERRQKAWAVLEGKDEERRRVDPEDLLLLDRALYRHMYRKAKSQHGMSNAKEVTSQIWRTLYDFPSLKTCTRFNRFVLECVDVSWDLVAGIDGRAPRLALEYEGTHFDGDRHQRASGSSLRSVVIKQFLWPGLVDASTRRLLHKAVVLT